MTADTVPTLLDAILDPLASIQKQVQAALQLGRRNKLPPPFLACLEATIWKLDSAWETLNEIATTLDPHRNKHTL